MTQNIVMIHGMWGGSWVWDNYKRIFEDKGYTCYTPALRYHDTLPSEKPDLELKTADMTPDQSVEAVKDYLMSHIKYKA